MILLSLGGPGGRRGAPLSDALVGAVRGRIRECGIGTPLLILSAMGSEKDGARAATAQRARHSHSPSGGRGEGLHRVRRGAGAARDGGAVPEARSDLKRTVHARSGLQGRAARW